MSAQFDEIERQARLLPLNEKATLARVLIEELDTSFDADAEQLWIDEAQRRYDAYLKGELEALPGDDVMVRARSRVAAESDTESTWNAQDSFVALPSAQDPGQV